MEKTEFIEAMTQLKERQNFEDSKHEIEGILWAYKNLPIEHLGMGWDEAYKKYYEWYIVNTNDNLAQKCATCGDLTYITQEEIGKPVRCSTCKGAFCNK